MKWIKWADQSKLARKIQGLIDTGNYMENIVDDIDKYYNPKNIDPFSREEIEKEIEKLTKIGLIVNNEGWLQVSEWSNDAVIEAFGDNYLKKMKKMGIFHPDMLKDNVITQKEFDDYNK